MDSQLSGTHSLLGEHLDSWVLLLMRLGLHGMQRHVVLFLGHVKNIAQNVALRQGSPKNS